MSLYTRLLQRLAATQYVQQAIDEKADLSAFKKPPSARLVIGVSVIGLGMLTGWPLVAALGGVAVYIEDPWLFLVGSPVIYGISWIIWAIGMAIAGAENIKYANIFLKWALRRYFEKRIDLKKIEANQGEKSDSEKSIGSASKSDKSKE